MSRIGTGLLRLALNPARAGQDSARISAAAALTSKRLYVLLEGDWRALSVKDFTVSSLLTREQLKQAAFRHSYIPTSFISALSTHLQHVNALIYSPYRPGSPGSTPTSWRPVIMRGRFARHMLVESILMVLARHCPAIAIGLNGNG